MKFIDLFAGLGGFHIALSQLGAECVFASELDEELRNIYYQNHGIMPEGDIRKVTTSDIPPHDILCAGFPCQPFSSAGKKKGSTCPKSGKLIDEVFRIAKYHAPKYIFLENVPQIMTIQNGEFWEYLKSSLEEMDYVVDHKQYSPHEFGIPQQRLRIFVVARKKWLPTFSWPETNNGILSDINSIIDNKAKDQKMLENEKVNILNIWQSFLDNVTGITSHAILAAEFGANYPIENLNKLSFHELRKHKGAFGYDLMNCKSKKECIAHLPDYFKQESGMPPKWIIPYINKSRELYQNHKEFLDIWKLDLVNKHKSWQKLEWRGNRKNAIISDHLIQFRASGIRIIKPALIPSLVAMTSTQVPIIGSKMRYLSTREAASLQAMGSLKVFPATRSGTFKALGNAVNAKIINCISQEVLCQTSS